MLQNVYQEQNVSCFSGLCSGGTAAIGQKRCQTVFADVFLRPGAAKHNSCSQAWIWNMKTCKKNGGLHQLPFTGGDISSTLSLGAIIFSCLKWLCEVTDGMAFGSIAVVAVNRRMTMMFGKRVVFPTTHLSTSPKVIGQNWYFRKNEGWILTFFLRIRSDKDGFCPCFFDKRSIPVGYWKGYYKIRNFHEKMRDSMRRWWSRCSHATNKFGTTGWLFEEIRNAGWGRGYELVSWFL